MPKTIVGKVIDIAINVPVKKKDGGTYPGWTLIYNVEGKVETLAKHMNSLKFAPKLKESLESLQKDDTVSVELEKGESGYWEVVSIAKGDDMPKPVKEEAPKRQYRSDRTVRDDTVQTMIVRQSSLAQAVAFSKGGSDVGEVLATAEEFENWVKRGLTPEAE